MISWNGIGQPTKNLDRLARIRLRNGCEIEAKIGDMEWVHGGHGGDIVAYSFVLDAPEILCPGGKPVWDADDQSAPDSIPVSKMKQSDLRPGAVFTTDEPIGNGEVAGPTGKQSNPKDFVGSRKVPLSTLPFRVLWRVGLAMLEGMCKYGRHNYRAVGVRASVYFDGAMRHIGAWWEGEDIDADSGFNHIDKAIADLMVLRDSMLQGNWVDDRPPSAREDFPALHAEAARIVDLHKDKKPHHFTIADSAEVA